MKVSFKILTIIGARPQFIKAAVLSRAYAKYPGIKEIILHTGQHYDENMSERFFRELEIPEPSYNLEVIESNNALMISRMMEGIIKVIEKVKPDAAVVFGDTNTTLAGAIAACKCQIPLAHVEAGLRSFNSFMPEEKNRILTDSVSDWLFCPTQNAFDNLLKEGFEKSGRKIYLSGDVMYDSALHFSSKLQASAATSESNDFVLVSVHRAVNTDNAENLKSITEALNEVSDRIRIVFPLHPRTKKQMESIGVKLNFETCEPQGYFDTLKLLRDCKLVMTDSGGLQKESYFFGKNCVILRDETEWTELITLGSHILAGADKDKILGAFGSTMNLKIKNMIHCFGEGKAGEFIAEKLFSYLKAKGK
ncbi:MAG: UDP-N-acetylglucosamine 2-epimerase (non-hydrolyzing) [Bacteroidetes bacterium]|nr:MAG: UDP-N-acetylglucosamine 2-epimerase (non-hydrolyzing) [Bacteroidota bacterium]